MTQYDNTNSGAIFKNDKKESDSHPDYKGSINAKGVEYYASVWINTSKTGQKYMSIKLKDKSEVRDEAMQSSSPQVQHQNLGQPNASAKDIGLDDFDESSIPF